MKGLNLNPLGCKGISSLLLKMAPAAAVPEDKAGEKCQREGGGWLNMASGRGSGRTWPAKKQGAAHRVLESNYRDLER